MPQFRSDLRAADDKAAATNIGVRKKMINERLEDLRTSGADDPRVAKVAAKKFADKSLKKEHRMAYAQYALEKGAITEDDEKAQ